MTLEEALASFDARAKSLVKARDEGRMTTLELNFRMEELLQEEAMFMKVALFQL